MGRDVMCDWWELNGFDFNNSKWCCHTMVQVGKTVEQLANYMPKSLPYTIYITYFLKKYIWNVILRVLWFLVMFLKVFFLFFYKLVLALICIYRIYKTFQRLFTFNQRQVFETISLEFSQAQWRLVFLYVISLIFLAIFFFFTCFCFFFLASPSPISLRSDGCTSSCH